MGGDAASIQRKVDGLPGFVKKNLFDNNLTIDVVGDSVVEARPDFAGVRPRGWPLGKTWDVVPGLFSADTNTVILATNGKYPTGSFDMYYHEIGHAFDHYNGLSISDRFMSAYSSDKSSMSSYFLQPGKAGPSEAFAESFARYYGGDPKIKSNWPNLNSYMGTLKTCIPNGGC